MLNAEMICGTWEVAGESKIPGEAANVTVVHHLMDAMACDELLGSENPDITQMLELWDDLADTIMISADHHDPSQADDLITITNYLSGQLAVYLMSIS